MSDTPRTDEEIARVLGQIAADLCAEDNAHYAIDRLGRLARTLERELAAAQARYDALVKEADKFEDGVDWIQRALQAEAEAEALRADADRYRWLREERFDADLPTVQSTTVGCIGTDLTGEDLDAAIDAARETK